MRHGSIVPTHRLKAWIQALALTALWVCGAVLAPALAEPSVPAGQEKEPAVPEAHSGQQAAAAVETTAEDEGWPLVDELTGRRYRIEKLRKIEGSYQWIRDKEHWIRMPLGAEFEVVEHDDQWFWVKYLEPRHTLPTVRKKQGPSDEELEKAAASYRFELATGDRLRFEEFDRGLPRQGQWRNGFDVADMNGDGHLDIVFGPSRKGRARPHIFLGDSRGNWRHWDEARFPSQPYDYGDVEAADFNGDGHLDLAFGIHLRGLLVLVADGEGGFEPWSEGIGLDVPGKEVVSASFSSRAVDSIDWNRDGKLDVIALGEGATGKPNARNSRLRTPTRQASRGFLVYLNRGDGTWFPWQTVRGEAVRRPNFGDGFVIGDFNRDQRADLLSVSSQMASNKILWLGEEDGRLTVSTLAEVRPNGLVTAVASADLNRDGYGDAIIAYLNRELGVWRTGLDVVYGAADLTWTRRPLVSEESRRRVTSLATGELDGNVHPDLVALTGRGEILFFLGDGNGFFLREMEELTPSEEGCGGFGLRLVDLDEDGRDEVIASFAGEPTGYTGIPGLSHPGCAGQGSLRAWKAVPAPPAP